MCVSNRFDWTGLGSRGQFRTRDSVPHVLHFPASACDANDPSQPDLPLLLNCSIRGGQ